MKILKKHYFLRILLSGFLLMGALFYFGLSQGGIESKTNSNLDLFSDTEKQKGAHVFGKLDSVKIQPLIRSNFEWITFVPYSDQKDFDSPNINIYGDSLQVIKRDSFWQSQIEIAKTNGFKIFLKPHIWIFAPTDGTWRSEIFPTNEKNWEIWKKSYHDFIIRYAKLAQRTEVEMFCIGAELTRLALEKPIFWKNLIREVRSIYSGKITYAANWYQEFEKITFWDELDFIGIQAYFPLVKNETPSISQISKGWKKHLPLMKRIAKKFNKKILFTELGYKSTTNSAINPWQWIGYPPTPDQILSIETQANCYEAFFKTIWDKKWFAGVHIWQWGSNHERAGGNDNMDFSPQRKAAEVVIAKGFENK